MLEALVALSLVGNIVQFVDFGIKAGKTVRELCRSTDGSIQRLSEIEKEAFDQAELFKTILKGSLKDRDPKLLKLAATCSSISDERVALLRSLQLDPQKNRLVQAISKSFKSHVATSRIKEIELGLLKIRDDVCTRLQVLLRYIFPFLLGKIDV